MYERKYHHINIYTVYIERYYREQIRLKYTDAVQLQCNTQIKSIIDTYEKKTISHAQTLTEYEAKDRTSTAQCTLDLIHFYFIP